MEDLKKENIGSHAGHIWHLLHQRGLLSIRQIGELTSYKESIIYLSLGWLARENKIKFLTTHSNILVRLKQ